MFARGTPARFAIEAEFLHHRIIISMARMKKSRATPRRKRMTRQQRLSSAVATHWVNKYTGKNIIKGYAKWFAVDPLCALMELAILGVKIDPERENRIKASIEVCAAARRRRQQSRAQAALDEIPANADEYFAYIAGYTAGGVPYGIPLEDFETLPPCVGAEDEGIDKTD